MNSASSLFLPWAFQVMLVVKNPPARAGDATDLGSIPGSGRSLEWGMATHSSILALKVPWTKEPGRLQSKGSQKNQRRLSTHSSSSPWLCWVCCFALLYLDPLPMMSDKCTHSCTGERRDVRTSENLPSLILASAQSEQWTSGVGSYGNSVRNILAGFQKEIT